MGLDALKGHLELLVLAVLRDGPLHGYGVIEQLRFRSGGSLDFPEGTVYPVLHKLESRGLLKSSWTTADGRRRRTYTLTRRGRSALQEQERAWRSVSRGVNAVLAWT